MANPVAVTTAPSTWDTIKNGVIDGANWTVRQVQWLGSTIKDYAVKVFEWAMPFFESIGKFLQKNLTKSKSLLLTIKKLRSFF